MKYCSDCGGKVEKVLFENETFSRFQCVACSKIHYNSPKLLVSCYAIWQGKILWMRRATPPRKGRWTAPSGFVEHGEDLKSAAARELFEETRGRVDVNQMQLHMIGSLPDMAQVYIVYRAPLLSPEFSVTNEASDVCLFSRDEFPDAEFAYPEVMNNIDLIYRDIERGRFHVYMGHFENGKNIVQVVNDRE